MNDYDLNCNVSTALKSGIMHRLHFEVYTCSMRLKRNVTFVFKGVASFCVWQHVRRTFISRIAVDLAQSVTLLIFVPHVLLFLKDHRWSGSIGDAPDFCSVCPSVPGLCMSFLSFQWMRRELPHATLYLERHHFILQIHQVIIQS
jgi:hypothetical protein